MNKKSGFKPLQNDQTKRDSALGSLLNSEHIVEIEKMVVGGDGLARIQHLEKSLVVFIPKSAPKDTLKVKITSVEKNFLFGSIIEVLKAGPSRREPPCVYAKRCGGCSWQQISEDEQIIQKELLLKELLNKFIPNLAYNLFPTIRSPKLFNYRNRIQLKHQQTSLGYFEDKTHVIVDIDSCLIADEKISAEIPKLKQKLKLAIETEKYELKLNQNNAFEVLRIGEKGEGLSFSQVNSELNTRLVQAVVEIAGNINPNSITELYAGSGNFTFQISKQLKNTTIQSVELNPALTSAATKKIITENLQKKITFFTTDCDSFVKRKSLSKDMILLDPPRAGCSDTILEKVLDSECTDILYVSCHPASLARDLQKLDLKKNGYLIESLQIFDMFPQTDHFETLIWLKKRLA